MVVKSIKRKYDEVARDLFKSKFNSLLNYVKQNEPSFDMRATKVAEGFKTLGYKNSQQYAGLISITQGSSLFMSL